MKSEKKFKVFDGDTFKFYRVFFNRRQAKIRGEELKLTGDVRRYRVEQNGDGSFNLWIH